ncbi:hypothetical protein AMTRI_Chr05g74400 [Amborella trichopoda]
MEFHCPLVVRLWWSFVLLSVVAMLCCASGTTVHVVGYSARWDVPQNGNTSFYQEWANSRSFCVGDILSFNFTTGHDVAQVRKAEYDACTAKNPISPVLGNGPVDVNLTASGEHYFLCSIGRHCSLGQHVSISVSPAPGEGPMIARPTPPPSSPASTHSFSEARVFAFILLSFLVYLST